MHDRFLNDSFERRTNSGRQQKEAWLESVENSLSILSIERLTPKRQYELLKAALEDLDRGNVKNPRFERTKALKYIDTAIQAFKQAQAVPSHHLLLFRILVKARRYSLAIGDKRSAAILDLQLGRILWLLNRQTRAKQAYERGIATIEALSDRSFAEYCKPYLILYHTIRGEPLKVLDCYRSISSSVGSDPDPFILNHIVPIVALNAAFLGQFRFGRRILKHAWGAAKSRGYASAERHIESTYGWLLLSAAELDKARPFIMMDAEPENGSLPLLDFWIQRRKAYLLFAEGDMGGAYELMKSATAVADANEVQTEIFLAPWMLEMQRGFDWSSFPTIPGFDYNTQIEKLMAGSNPVMKGAAYRLLALDAGCQGQEAETRLRLLNKSEELLEGASAQIELSKTWLEKTRLHVVVGNIEAAKATAVKAWQVLSYSAPALFPQDLSHLLEPSSMLTERAWIWPDYADLVTMLAQLSVPITRNDLLSQITGIACSFFGAEGAALYSRNRKNDLAPVCIYNIHPIGPLNANRESNLFLVRQALDMEKPLYSGFGERHDQSAPALCIPLHLPDGKAVFYLTAFRSIDLLDDLPAHQIVPVTEHVGQLLSMVIGLLATTEDAHRLHMGQVTAGTAMTDREPLYRSPAMEQVIRIADLSAQSDASVVVLGETGVGKELIARYIHRHGTRHDMPFVTVDLSILPESLIESELFGHEKGSFTGANEQKTGQIELADKGTLFVDEIGDAPLSVQAKLLRVLQEKSYKRVGGTKVLRSDFRLIVATNKDLLAAIRNGHFREDLYYRLNVISIFVPPLRERLEDIIYLARHFLTHFSRKHNKPAPLLTADNELSLKTYPWPGNVRELKNLMERTIVLQDASLFNMGFGAANQSVYSNDELRVLSLKTLNEIESEYIRLVLKHTQGKIAGRGGAAEILGINRSTLYHRMKKLGITEKPFADQGVR
jgi:DNA-binding NtrC family response regulator/tetratricopeptide (TPR) repeat protein